MILKLFHKKPSSQIGYVSPQPKPDERIIQQYVCFVKGKNMNELYALPEGNVSMRLNGVLSLHSMQECSMCSHRGRMGTRGDRDNVGLASADHTHDLFQALEDCMMSDGRLKPTLQVLEHGNMNEMYQPRRVGLPTKIMNVCAMRWINPPYGCAA